MGKKKDTRITYITQQLIYKDREEDIPEYHDDGSMSVKVDVYVNALHKDPSASHLIGLKLYENVWATLPSNTPSIEV